MHDRSRTSVLVGPMLVHKRFDDGVDELWRLVLRAVPNLWQLYVLAHSGRLGQFPPPFHLFPWVLCPPHLRKIASRLSSKSCQAVKGEPSPSHGAQRA